eukprot:15324642-Alexandrium_andersonii.AAC.1
MFLITSDGGSDQCRCRKLIKAETQYCLRTLVFDISCFQHGCALVVKGNLLLIDRWLFWVRQLCNLSEASFRGYYSAMAKLLH